ncbi:MAG: alpha/beta hydrolase fold domain-containing protein [Proteobacteria bacterium]|nr:alpha/beta hydrolase fold domain-containing protein [Pseudomonadota bacterium]
MSVLSFAAINKQLSLSRRLFLGNSLAAAAFSATARADEAAPAGTLKARQLPARSLPVPETVSEGLQAVIAAPYPPGWNVLPEDAATWKDLAAKSAAGAAPAITAIREHFGLTVEQTKMAGVPVFVITPHEIAPENRDRLLVHIHGGGYVLFPGEAGAGEGMLMAGYGRCKVVSIDYRMAPDYPYPAALDDVMAVWGVLLAAYDPRKMAIFGTSAGGALTLCAIHRAKAEGVPLPGAIAPGSPIADLTWAGDTIMANAFVDNALVSRRSWANAAGALYAASHDPRNPMLSPIFGDFSGFPPAILTSGTRDLLLSDTVRTHRKLRKADVTAALQVLEGQSHAQYLSPFLPETEEAFGEIAKFLNDHLTS